MVANQGFATGLEFHLNQVGYKAGFEWTLEVEDGGFHLNQVGYKALLLCPFKSIPVVSSEPSGI